ncbi:CobW family GTP-binding protein [Paenibacillus sp. WLX1005]|uniref:CobW family GTP-binding protein n=1 Tax=Paenibacillus sp. WLX1005 TaxID=3243766 RepID=UPI0039844ABD
MRQDQYGDSTSDIAVAELLNGVPNEMPNEATHTSLDTEQLGDPRIPVTIVTGFLGSGKTTLLNHLLTGDHGQKIAVIVNEFGEVGIDNELIVRADDEIIEMNNGCICCTVRSDLVDIAVQLLHRKFGQLDEISNEEKQEAPSKGDFDRIVIETTGLADPGPVIQTFLAEELLAQFYKLDAVLTLVDAYHAHLNLDQGPEAKAQIAFADVLLLNKTDLVAEQQLQQLEARLRRMNAYAPIHRTQYSSLNIEQLLGIYSFDVEQKLEVSPDFLHAHHHHHEDEVQSIVLQEDRPLDLQCINRFIDEWLMLHAEDTYRYKGIVHVANVEQRVVFQGVHMMLGINTDRSWQQDEPRSSRIVIIGKHLDEAWFQKQFADCVAEPATYSPPSIPPHPVHPSSFT